MEGLIKGLVDVALGDGGDRDGRDGDDEARDERSRSSWAQVVSGDQDNNDDRPHGHNPPIQWRRRENQQEHEDWEVWGSKPSRRSHEEQEKENNDGWETVGRKPQRRPHKVQMDQWQGYKRPPSEQEYSDEVEAGTSIKPSEEELADLSQACNRLWQLDLNRLEPGKDYQIDYGEGKKVYQKEDMAEGSLFYSLTEDIFRKRTFSRFCSLLDNYNPNAGCKEVVTSEEKQEQSAFIEEISRTAPIKYLHKYLSLKGIVSENYQDFKRNQAMC
ncbi:hypothetical protein CRYUN_Cryun12cG0020100 [Craigia yunnanensis]